MPFSGFDLLAHERGRVRANAARALAERPRTVVAVVNPRSAGGPHDFSSEGDYWWPDPANPDGPYIRRDGLSNPENFTAHRELLLDFAATVGALGAAYLDGGDETYAEAALIHLRAWFADPATRMNPDLRYAQAIHGVCEGRGIGIIDTVHLAEVALACEVLRGSRAWREEDAAIVGWFAAYLDWLCNDPKGLDESREANNHGTCWALQVAAFARLTGNVPALEVRRRHLLGELLPDQMAADGSFPLELARTKPYAYSIFNLDVMTALARILSTETDDFVAHTLPDGRSLVRGMEFLATFLADKEEWPYARDVMYWDDWPVRQPSLLFAAEAADRADWLDLWRRLTADPRELEIRRNFPIRYPSLWRRRTARLQVAAS